jgi:hypothetical protein
MKYKSLMKLLYLWLHTENQIYKYMFYSLLEIKLLQNHSILFFFLIFAKILEIKKKAST